MAPATCNVIHYVYNFQLVCQNVFVISAGIYI